MELICTYQSELADDLSSWSVEIPGKVSARGRSTNWSYDPTR